jgi:hypothetical protein
MRCHRSKQLRLEDPGHRDAHQHMQPIGVDLGLLAPQPGNDEAASATGGGCEHEHREAARKPTRLAHSDIP